MQQVLARGACSRRSRRSTKALAKAVDAHGVAFEPALAIVAGEIEFAFDEVEALRALLTIAAPFVTADARLKDAVDGAFAATRAPGFERSGPAADRVSAAVLAPFADLRRALPPRYLEAHTERLLVEGRCYPRRTLLGAVWLRAWTVVAGASEPVPTYFPAHFLDALPLVKRMRARFVAEITWPQEELAGGPRALFVVALSRVR